MGFDPKAAYYSKQNATQKKNNSTRNKHQNSSSQGGCSSNYTKGK